MGEKFMSGAMACKPRRVAPEELIGEFDVVAMLKMCGGDCEKRELEVVTEKTCTGFCFSRVICKHKEECQNRVMTELGEGGIR